MFFRYAGSPKRSGDMYIGGCPICREGKSWGKKFRARYMPGENYFFCHNEGQSWSPYQWIKAVTGWSYEEIEADIKIHCGDEMFEKASLAAETYTPMAVPDLPGDAIDICDPAQVEFHKDVPIVQRAIKYAESRRLFTAKYRSPRLYVSQNDPIHRNRLIIPYIGRDNTTEYYVSRQLMEFDVRAKYLGKLGNKYMFNLNKVDSNLKTYFLHEGHIDSMFVQNGVAASGVVLTDYQKMLLAPYDLMMDRIWVPDNQIIDETARDRTKDLINQGEKVFIWPREMEKWKDFNAFAIEASLDEVPYQLILKYAKTGDQARLALGY